MLRKQTLWSISGLWLILILTIGCAPRDASTPNADPPPREKLAVAAAANLKFAFEEIETAFERLHPQVDCEVTYGSSGNFFAQLSQKAPFDIFFSADTKAPQGLVEAGLASQADYFPYASGRIVVWVPNDSPLDLDALGIRAVIDPPVKKIAIANPRLAPYGAAAEEALQSLSVADEARDRIVLGENIMQTAHFVESGAADVGILALSLAVSPEMKQRGRYWEIPAEAHRPIDQAAVTPAHCQNRDAAIRLREFVTGPEGRAILARYGYQPPKDE